MAKERLYRLKTIAELHRFRGLPAPQHPLVSVVNVESIKQLHGDEPMSLVLDFYCIALKRNFNGQMRYGQQEYDFDDGILTFMAPGQVFGIEVNKGEELQHSGWILYIHPDFIWRTPLASKIREYEYFDYAVHEALHLSEKEESTLAGIMQSIAQEYHSNIDPFSQDVIIAQIELLLTYADRFYTRQFITRRVAGHQLLERLEAILAVHFASDELAQQGPPSVSSIADRLHVSPNYLSAQLRVLTGQSTQQHIQDKLIEKAKEKLSTTQLSVSEIAYALGFEYSQSFSKFFKSKTNLSPIAFRQSFN